MYYFDSPLIDRAGHMVFVLSVCLFVSCLSVVNIHLRYNLWTGRDSDFIFGMQTLMMPFFNDTKVNDLNGKYSFLGLCC